ncbi:hypothetical protein D9757_001006 [Collybiopsis confluens]|uniref:Uncharacterized protein n=1 Tax=Collybiopsis confluens TaxID=2823264 RepID=A0A8H5I0E3_9AGAR|nr:hypothetical protein D9757_001006 [Collybiopsis confluens]
MTAILHAILLLGSSWSFLTVVIKFEFGTAFTVANLAILTPYVYQMVNPEGDFDSKPATYYRSFQPDGCIVMRRVSALAPVVDQNNETGWYAAPSDHRPEPEI